MRTFSSLSVIVFLATAPVFCFSATILSSSDESFLAAVAQDQHAEIALGQLAAQKASSNQLKQLAERMVEDHRRASQEIRLLASMEGVLLPTQIRAEQRLKQEELSQLSGKEFDQAYLQYMVHNRDQATDKFEQNAKTLHNPELRIWAFGTLPVLKFHVVAAKHIISNIQVKFPQSLHQRARL